MTVLHKASAAVRHSLYSAHEGAGGRGQDGFILMSVNGVGRAGRLGSAGTTSHRDSSMVTSEYMDCSHGGPGSLEKVLLERASGRCQSPTPEAGTPPLLLCPTDQAVIQPRLKEQRCKFYLLRG